MNFLEAQRILSKLFKLGLGHVSQMIIWSGRLAFVVLFRKKRLRLMGRKGGGIVSFFRDSPLGEAVRAEDITFIRESGRIREV